MLTYNVRKLSLLSRYDGGKNSWHSSVEFLPYRSVFSLLSILLYKKVFVFCSASSSFKIITVKVILILKTGFPLLDNNFLINWEEYVGEKYTQEMIKINPIRSKSGILFANIFWKHNPKQLMDRKNISNYLHMCVYMHIFVCACDIVSNITNTLT